MFEEMSKDEILDLWDAVAASPPSDSGASIKAFEFAGDLINAFCAIAEESDGREYLSNAIEDHKDFFVKAIAKRCQTLMDEGKI